MTMAYKLEGSSLEACSCEESCPCWTESGPNEGCDTVLTWHIDRGTIEDVDVSGRAVAVVASTPCSTFDDGASSATVYVDAEATSEQEEALLEVWTGRMGGPVAELVGLFGDVTGTGRSPITFEGGTLTIGREARADTAPLREAEGRAATIQESVLSTAPGAADLSESPSAQEYNAVRASFRFEA
jgi:hypothetical protein